jgi:transposase
MAQISKFLTDDLVAKAKSSLKQLGKYGSVAVRLQIIISAKEQGITDVCRVHGISRTTLTDWIKRFSQEEVNALENKAKKPRNPLSDHLDTLKEWVEKDSNITARELVLKIEEKLKIQIGMSSVYRLLNKLKLSYITLRPKHYKQNTNSHKELKKI